MEKRKMFFWLNSAFALLALIFVVWEVVDNRWQAAVVPFAFLVWNAVYAIKGFKFVKPPKVGVKQTRNDRPN